MFMNVLKLCASASLLVIAAFLSGCTGDCNRASDCAAGEVCYAGLCEPGSEEALSKTCSSDVECNGQGGTGFVCRAGRCQPDDTLIPKADAGLGNPDMGMIDMGPMMDTGTSTAPDGGSIPTDTGVPDMG